MSTKKPMLLVIAGPNGSGKSTISQYFEKVGQYTNADDIVASTGMDIVDAAKLADRKRYDAISNKQDLSFETVLSSEYKLEILRHAKQEGYFIKCIFILTVNPDINIARVKARVAQGGHDVTREKITSRYAKSLANIKELLEICDIMHVYDNSVKPVRIIRKHKDDISIFPNDLWDIDMIKGLLEHD